MKSVQNLALQFKKKYPFTIAWRIRKNARVIESHLNPGETVQYAFVAQKSSSIFDIFQTSVVALTNNRILIGRKRVVFGYFLDGVTPDLFNDLKVISGILWGKIIIDTVREEVILSHIDKSALDEIETTITTYMMSEKQKYPSANGKMQ